MNEVALKERLKTIATSNFAEKLETIISKGLINSRMKDYHDLLVMIREPSFLDIEKLSNSIQATFNR